MLALSMFVLVLRPVAVVRALTCTISSVTGYLDLDLDLDLSTRINPSDQVSYCIPKTQ